MYTMEELNSLCTELKKKAYHQLDNGRGKNIWIDANVCINICDYVLRATENWHKFDYVTAANLCNGNKISENALLNFVQHARWTYENYRRSVGDIQMLRNTIQQRESEIELLKSALLEKEDNNGS